MTTDLDPVERLVQHAEMLAASSSRIEDELREQVLTLRKGLRLTRWIGGVLAVAIVAGIVGGFWIAGHQRQQQRDAFCGLIAPIAVSERASADVRHEAAKSAGILGCPE